MVGDGLIGETWGLGAWIVAGKQMMDISSWGGRGERGAREGKCLIDLFLGYFGR